MRIIHRISLAVDRIQQKELRRLGVEVDTGLATFEIDESTPAWPEVELFVSKWDALDVVTTEFTSNELNSADYLKLTPSWHHGYPQPEAGFRYLPETYDLSAYCSKCGIGKRQTAPFHIKAEPKWGKKHFLQLNWVFDEFFVKPDIWKEVFNPIGVNYRPVRHHRTGSELETVVQVDIDHYSDAQLDVPSQDPPDVCGACGMAKHTPISRGFFPAFRSPPQCDVCKTREFFGSGATAWNAIIVSRRLYTELQERKLKGVTFVPLAKGELRSGKVSGTNGT